MQGLPERARPGDRRGANDHKQVACILHTVTDCCVANPAAQDEEVLDFDDAADTSEDGVLVFHQPRPKDREMDRIKIKREEVLMAYTDCASDIPEYPVMPQHGFGAQSMYGDWFVYNDMELCTKFVEQYDSMVVRTEEGAIITLTVKAMPLSVNSIKEGKMNAKIVDSLSVHIGVKLPNGILFRYITGAMIKKFFEERGFRVLKQNRAGVKFNGQRIKDAGLGGEMFHMNIRPVNGDVLGAFYPEQVELLVRGTNQYLDYKIFDHPDLKGMICQDDCHRYKNYAFDQLRALEVLPRNWCQCDELAKSKPGPSRGGPSGAQAFFAALRAHKAAKGVSECQHFKVGKCYAVGGKGAKCAFAHDVDPGTIECALGNACKGPPKCAYAHSASKPMCAATTEPPWEPD